MRRWLTWFMACAFLLFQVFLSSRALAAGASPAGAASGAASGSRAAPTAIAEDDEDDGDQHDANQDEDEDEDEDQGQQVHEDKNQDDEQDEEDAQDERQHGLEQALKALERLAAAAAASGQPEAVDAVLQDLAARIQQALAAGDTSSLKSFAKALKEVIDEVAGEADEHEDEDARQGDAARLMAAAGLSAATGALDTALEALRAAALEDPKNLEVYGELAKVRRQLGGQGILAFVEGEELAFDVQPLLEQNRVLVPVRKVAEALGARVAYDREANTVTIRQGGREVVLAVGQPTAWIDGQQVALDVPAQVVDGRLVVPLRFVAQAFGAKVSWLAQEQAIVITR